MRNLSHPYSYDHQVIADLQGKIDRAGLLKLRAQIDRMRSQNMRHAALVMWHEKVKVPER